MTWLGALNFVILQWFGVRLARVYATRQVDCRISNAFVVSGGGISIGCMAKLGEPVFLGWKLLRWIWPLTGWWSSYRWIARRR